MIYIIYSRVVRGVNGELYTVQHRMVSKFPNDFEFDFDIFKPKNWLNFLKTYKYSGGKNLPRFSKVGDPITYYVYMIGMEKHIREYLGKSSRSDGAYHILFPGVDKEKSKLIRGNKSLEIARFGRID